MSFKVGDLVKLHLGSRWSPRAAWRSDPSLADRFKAWRGRVIDLREAGEEDVWGGTELGDKLAHVAPPIKLRDGEKGAWCMETLGSARTRRPSRKSDLCSRVEYTTIPVGWLEMEERPKRPKSAAKGRPPKKGAKWKAKKQERDEAIEFKKDDDDAWFLDARAGDLGDADADFHDAADTREKTLSAATQRDLALARSKRKGGRGRRRRRKRTRRTRRRKKRRTRRRRRKRTRRRRRR